MPTPMETSRAILEVAAGPAPTFWQWKSNGMVKENGASDGGMVLMCAHCRRQVHDHDQDCAWVVFKNAVLRGAAR